MYYNYYQCNRYHYILEAAQSELHVHRSPLSRSMLPLHKYGEN